MNQEPVTEPINEGDNTPATKGELKAVAKDVKAVAKDVATLANDLDDLAEATQKGFEEITTKVDGLASKVEGLATKQDVERILNEFKVVAENIHKDVAGANKDQIDLWTNQVPDHEDRIVDLEEHAGIQTGPRFQHIK